MRTEFELVAESYLAARQQLYASNATAEFIRRDLPNAVEAALGSLNSAGLIVKGSAGKGQWTESPWVTIMDTLVTTTPQDGYYVVYLFSASMKRVVLSLNQGITEVRNNLPAADAKQTLRHTAALIRATVPEHSAVFSSTDIQLDPGSNSMRSAFYQAGHAFGITYNFPLPAEQTLVAHLQEMVRLYRLLTFRGWGTEPNGSVTETLGIEDTRRYRLHRRIERNRKLAAAAKRTHGFACQACGFDFEYTYGPLGQCYIEAHHLTPLHTLPKDKPAQLDAKLDFAVLCANCHRMVHRKDAPGSFTDFTKLVKARMRIRNEPESGHVAIGAHS